VYLTNIKLFKYKIIYIYIYIYISNNYSIKFIKRYFKVKNFNKKEFQNIWSNWPNRLIKLRVC